MLKPSQTDPRDFIVQISVNIPDGHYSELLPFRVSPEQMKHTTLRFDAVNTIQVREDDEVKPVVMDYGQTIFLKDLIGQGISRELLEQAKKGEQNKRKI